MPMYMPMAMTILHRPIHIPKAHDIYYPPDAPVRTMTKTHKDKDKYKDKHRRKQEGDEL